MMCVHLANPLVSIGQLQMYQVIGWHIVYMSSCGPPGWAYATVWTCWLKNLSADTFYMCLFVALLDGANLLHHVGLYAFYMLSAEIHWHVLYAKSTHSLKHTICAK